MNKSQATQNTLLFYIDPDIIVAKKLWNMIDQGSGKAAFNLTLPWISTNQKIYVPNNIFPIINIEFLKQPSKVYPLSLTYTKELLKKNKEYIKIRVLYNKSLKLFPQKGTKQSIIIHIHGGGFIGMSSSSHQIYTRLFSKQLGIIIFSIDYRLSPEHQFPIALNDVFQSYLHIIQICEKVYKIQIDKIILMGDSAGGNLVAALQVLLIQTELRGADGIFMIYPALHLQDSVFSPSHVISLTDMLLPAGILKLCLNAYLGDNKDLSNELPTISPLLASEQILKQFPIVRIIVGEQDSFKDDCYRMTHKLAKINKDVQLITVENFPHGFMNMDVPIGIPQSKQVIQYAIQVVKEMLQQN